MTSSPWLDTLIMILVVGIPVGLVVFYLRRPYDAGAVPRDALASRGKGKVSGVGLLVWPTKTYRETLIDSADDASHGKPNHDGNAEEFDTNDFADSEEHRARVVRDLKSGW